MSIPQFSETWGAAYVQVIIALLVFFTGLPLLITQLSIPEDIRGIYIRYQSKNWIIFIILIAIISALLIIWYIHPCPGIISPDIESFVISFLVTILILCFLYIYWKLYSQDRQSLINSIYRRIPPEGGGGGGTSTIPNKVKVPFYKNRIYHEPFADLAYLGEFGKQGNEKNIVIMKIKHIVEIRILKQAYYYHFFDDEIISLKKTLMNKKQQGNESNFLLVLGVFKKIREFYHSELPDSEYDIKYVDKAIGTLCLECLSLEYDETAVLYQQEIKEDADELLRVGAMAIRQNKNNIALSCLRDLETIIDTKEIINNGKLKEKDFFQLLGLAAHVWSINIISQKDIEVMLENYTGNFSPSLLDSLKSAKDEYASIQDFDTALKIENLMNSKFPNGPKEKIFRSRKLK
jgi:hypothetical protein